MTLDHYWREVYTYVCIYIYIDMLMAIAQNTPARSCVVQLSRDKFHNFHEEKNVYLA